MLSRLHIQNYAIIEDLEISFTGNLNIITGETGAGKSILMGALNLILGERADSSVLQQDNKKCVVEGYFDINNKQIRDFILANELDGEDEIVIRREISANGKSRSFINDTPANLSQLKELAALLVDLHQQFDTLDVSNENFQRMVLDALADNAGLLQTLSETFHRFSVVKKELASLKQQQANANKELDYHRFLYDELTELALGENELEMLDVELSMLNNAESIKQQLSDISFQLQDSETPLVQQLKIMQQKLQGIQQYQPEIESLQERISSAVIELKDVASEIERINEGINYNAERIISINERISAGYKLQKKHGVTTTNELISIQQQLAEKLDEVVNATSLIESLEKQEKQLESEALQIAKSITAKRNKQVKPFTDNVNALLRQIGMPNARLKVSVEDGILSVNGADTVEFLFDANKGGRFEPLRKVASGGELSRLMLSIKSLVAMKLQLPTLIFDEIDTGISGEAARQVGIIMKELSARHQLISITHQPQIAARADAHYFVYKEIKKDKIVTSIRLLTPDERITAIAQMLSGEKPSAAALENAREMVRN